MARPLKPETAFSARLIEARRPMEREDFARLLDVPKTTLGNWERGRTFPPPEMLTRMSETLGVSLDWLISGRGEMRPMPSTGDMPPTALPIDEELHGRVVDGITAAYKEAGQGLAPVHLGRMTARLVNEIVAASDGPEDYPGALKLRLAQLRNELRSAASDPASSKRSA